jgi:flagellar hook-length control protein FliK
MTTSTILPPAMPKPAEIAAPPAAESANAAAADGGPSFGTVLESRMNKSGKDTQGDADGSSETTSQDATTESTETAEDAAPVESNSTLMDILSAAADARPVMADGFAQQMVQAKDPRTQAAPVAEHRAQSDDGIATLRAGDRDARVVAGAGLRSDDSGDAGADSGQQFRIEPAADEMRAATARTRQDDAEVVESKPLLVAASNQASNATPLAAGETRRAVEVAPLRLTVSQPVASKGWGEAVADRVTWVTQARQPSAEIQLNPPNLGPVEVRVSMNGDQATVSFFSAHAPVREALQSAMPRLTEAFAASGLSLGDVHVGADSRSGQDQGRHQQGRHTARGNDDDSAIGRVAAPAARWTSSVGGLRAVDLFA